MIQETVRFSANKSDSRLFLDGNLKIPENAKGIVMFVHGSGSNMKSTRNLILSQKLYENNIGTFLFDLLSEGEQRSDIQLEKIITQIPGAKLNKFNIPLLVQRLHTATEWIMNKQQRNKLEISYFASSTGAAAALIASTKFNISSIVVRSGRTDLINNDILPIIESPCLFLVGQREKTVIKISKQTLKKLVNVNEKNLEIIPNASHLLVESGTLEKVVVIATEWLKNHF